MKHILSPKLQKKLPRFRQLVSLRLAGLISVAEQSELKTIEESFDEYERKSPHRLVLQRWLNEIDRRQTQMQLHLDAIEKMLDRPK